MATPQIAFYAAAVPTATCVDLPDLAEGLATDFGIRRFFDFASVVLILEGMAFSFLRRFRSWLRIHGPPSAPLHVNCYCPAFDVTPAQLIRSIITERGIIQPVAKSRIAAILRS